MKKCPKCNAELEENSRFCLYCMTSFEEKAPTTELHKKRTRPIYITAAALLALIFAVILIIVLKNKPSNNSGNSSQSNTSSDISNETDNNNANSSNDNTADTPNDNDGSSQNETQDDTSSDITSENQNNNGSDNQIPNNEPSPPVDNNDGNNSNGNNGDNSNDTSDKTPVADGDDTVTTPSTDTKPTDETPEPETPKPENPEPEPSEDTVQPKFEYITADNSNAYPTGHATAYPVENTIVITKVDYVAKDGEYIIPETIDGKKVAAIMPNAFDDSTVSSAVKTLILPNTVRTVWYGALDKCYNLKDIYIKSETIEIYTDALPEESKRNETLTIHAKRDCINFDFYYYRNIIDRYAAVFEEWNG